MESIKCAVLERAIQRAREKGLPVDPVKCNVSDCDGTDCKTIDQPQTRHISLHTQLHSQPKIPVVSFYRRLEITHSLKNLNRQGS